MEVRLRLAIEQEPGLVVGERIGPIEAVVLLGDQLPELQVLLGAAHLGGRAASGVGEGEQVEEPVADEPGERDDLVGRVRLFEEERRASMEPDQPGDLLSGRQVAPEVSQDRAGEVLPLDGVLGGGDPARLGSTCDVSGFPESWNRAVKVRTVRSCGLSDDQPSSSGSSVADHLRVGPDVPLGMPPGILDASRHRPAQGWSPAQARISSSEASRRSSQFMTRDPPLLRVGWASSPGTASGRSA